MGFSLGRSAGVGVPVEHHGPVGEGGGGSLVNR
jgi:hypothetical protein